MSNKFCIIDQSIVGHGGHHLEYALRCVDGARENNLKPILAVGKKARLEEISDDIEVFPSFTHSFWENMDVPDPKKGLRAKVSEFKNWLIEKKQNSNWEFYSTFLYTNLGLSFRRAKEITSSSDDLAKLFYSDLVGVRTSPIDVLLLRIYQSLKYRSGLLYHNIIGRLVWMQNILRIRWLVRLIRRIVVSVFKLFFNLLKYSLIFVGGLIALPFLILYYFLSRPKSKRQIFKEELKNLINISKLSSDDYIFIPTLGETELLALSELCNESKVAKKIKWRLVFRRNIFDGRKPTYDKQRDLVKIRRSRIVFSTAKKLLKSADIEFYTDTDQLTDQYNSIRAFDFKTTCVVTPEIENKLASVKENDKVVVSYLGDARDEKNFNFIPNIMNFLHSTPEGRGRSFFRLQSNFNVEGGESNSAKALLELTGMPEDYCELLGGPFGSDKYVDVLVNSDIVLIPYDPYSYATRSSGILAEAMVAAKPVLTSGGSWMARVIEPMRQSYYEGIEARINKVNKKNKTISIVSSYNDYYNKYGNIFSNKRVNPDASYFFLKLRMIMPQDGAFMNVKFTFYDKVGTIIGVLDEITSLFKKEIRFFNKIPLGSVRVSISVSNLDPISVSIPDRLDYFELKTNSSLATGFAGAIAAPNDFAMSYNLQNIIKNIEIYKKQMNSIADVWRNFHCPNNLVKQIVSYESSYFPDIKKCEEIAYQHGFEAV